MRRLLATAVLALLTVALPAVLALLTVALPAAARAQAAEPAAEAPPAEAEPAAAAGSEAAAPAEGQAGEAAASDEEPAEEEEAIRLDGLPERVRARVAAEREEDRAREARFRAALEEQQRLLAETEALVAREEAASVALDERYGANELEIEQLGTRLTERLGQMGELFGVVRLVATDMSAEIWDSLTSLGSPQRTEVLEKLGRSKDLPSTEDMERLWYELQRELTEQAMVARVRVPVLAGAERGKVEMEVVRAGPFTAIGDGEYLQWAPAEQMLRRFERQPPPRYISTVEDFLEAEGGFARLAVDPSRGTLLEALTDTPSVVERVHQGGSVGYVIVVLGISALLLGLVRLADLVAVGRRVEVQGRRQRASDDNPLGRLRAVYEANRSADPEALELKLEDAVLREVSRLERFLWIVQTVSIVAPLLGLLGTVTGMIQTFQAITLFGAGDPKIMAGGISEALVTTTLGLITAIPLVLLYALLASRSRRIVETLDEGSAAMLADSIQRQAASA